MFAPHLKKFLKGVPEVSPSQGWEDGRTPQNIIALAKAIARTEAFKHKNMSTPILFGPLIFCCPSLDDSHKTSSSQNLTHLVSSRVKAASCNQQCAGVHTKQQLMTRFPHRQNKTVSFLSAFSPHHDLNRIDNMSEMKLVA